MKTRGKTSKTSKIALIILMLFVVFFVFVSCKNDQPAEESVKTNEVDKGEFLFSFAVFGDNGTINPTFESIIEKINESNVSFVVSVGDITNGKSRKDFVDFKNYLDKNLGTPYYIAVGDNDLTLNSKEERSSEDFISIIGPRNQSFDFKDSHFAIIDSSVESEGIFSGDLDWLEKDLVGRTDQKVFVFTHVPPETPLSSSIFGEPTESKNNSIEKFGTILKNSNVDHLYSGHFHGFLEYDFYGIPLTITGGAGSSPQFGLDPMPHFLVVDVYENTYENRVIKID